MNAITAIRVAPDDILTFVPGCEGKEYELRAKLRSHRSIAAAMIAQTESPTCRSLAWIAQDYASEFVFTLGVNLETLADIVKLCSRLLITAAQAEIIETVGCVE
jgi:hypothetical protein